MTTPVYRSRYAHDEALYRVAHARLIAAEMKRYLEQYVRQQITATQYLDRVDDLWLMTRDYGLERLVRLFIGSTKGAA